MLSKRTVAATLALASGLGWHAVKADGPATRTPIKHVVVLFQENRSFDHYFGTYPNAQNLYGENPFKARPNTPAVNGLTDDLLFRNPNVYQGAVINPIRLGPGDAVECSQTHAYTSEQQSADLGKMDMFVEYDGAKNNQGIPADDDNPNCDPRMVMGYFDGNTVTALWNYAQRFAMSDNSFASNWGSSTVGAINLVSGQTHGASIDADPKKADVINGTVIGNPRPLLDDCSPASTNRITMKGRNIGDLLNAKGVTWGWFNGGFRAANGGNPCTASRPGSNGLPQLDYIPHHEAFQYYASTANPHHVAPSSLAAVGQTDVANHQYDLSDFWAAADAGNLPAVSFLKPLAFQEGHNRYSDSLAEQQYLVETINRLQQLPEWKSMAILVVWDDSDGLYDHVLPPLVSSSATSADALTGQGQCGDANAPKLGPYQARCGYGPRLPLLVISPFAKNNFVDHTLTDQTSVIRFIEDNWNLGRIGDYSFDQIAGSIENMFDFSHNGKPRHLFLDPLTGQRLDDVDEN